MSQKQRDSEQLIAQYLLAHPDFFERHLDVLDKLRIPHPSGTAVSLLERQVRHLREHNHKLHHRLQELVKVARENDGLSRRMQNLNLILIEARGIGDMVRGVQSVLRDEFSVDFTALRLTMANPLVLAELDEQNRLTPAQLELFKSLLRSDRPLCGRLLKAQAEALFEDAAEAVASAAMVPLAGADWQGVLAIGSRDEQHFGVGMGTLFLSRLGELLKHAFSTTQLYPVDSIAP